MAVKTKKSFTEGAIFSKMLLFVFPIMLTSLLQVFYNMADRIVVGQFSGDENALAAIGSTASLTTLFINFVVGSTAGIGIAVSHAFGAADLEKVKKTVHTSFCFSLILGVSFGILGACLSVPLLNLMDTKETLMKGAVAYMLINCIGIPASAIYHCGATILRSVGDSKTSLYILSVTGVVNVVLNLFFVIFLNMSVEGVAIATVIAKYLSAIWVVFILSKRKNVPYSLSFKELTIDRAILKKVLRYGLPMGIQSSLFSISNVFVTSAVNTFETPTISAKAIANSIDSLHSTALSAYTHATMTFVGQNLGAKKPERIKKSILCSVAQSFLIGTVLTLILFTFKEPIALLYINPLDPAKDTVLDVTLQIMSLMLFSYILHGIMASFAGAIRGLGYSFTSMFINLLASCGLRILWIFVFFPMPLFNDIIGLHLIYPISWAIACVAYLVFIISRKKRILEKCGTSEV